jgi:hypothetical protein
VQQSRDEVISFHFKDFLRAFTPRPARASSVARSAARDLQEIISGVGATIRKKDQANGAHARDGGVDGSRETLA